MQKIELVDFWALSRIKQIRDSARCDTAIACT